MKKKRFLGCLLFCLLLLSSCARTPQGIAVGKAREGISIFLQYGTPTEEAVKALEEAERKLKEPFIEETLGIFYLCLEDQPEPEKAIPHLQRSKTPYAHLLLAQEAMKKEKWQEALSYLKDDNPFSLFLSAYIYAKSGDKEKSRTSLLKASQSEGKIPQSLLFLALQSARPLAVANLQYMSTKWLWDHMEEMAKECLLPESDGETRRALLKIGEKIAPYARIAPQYNGILSFFAPLLGGEEGKEMEKRKADFKRKTEEMLKGQMAKVFSLVRLLIVLIIGSILLVLIGLGMVIFGLVRSGRNDPLWRKGLIAVGIGMGIWLISALVFYPPPFGGMVQGYIEKRVFSEQIKLIRSDWESLQREIEKLSKKG